MMRHKTPIPGKPAGGLAVATAALVGISNQVVTSGTNFLLGIFMLRTLSLVEFGMYGTLFAACMTISGLIVSLFLGQMTVLFPEYEEVSGDRFAGSVLTMVASIFICSAFVCILLICLGPVFGFSEFAGHIAASLVFAVAYCLKEFFVRAAYCYRDETKALRVNIILAISLAAMLGIAYFAGIGLSANSILVLYAASCLIGAGWGYSEVRLPIIRDRRLLTSTWSDLWVGGKWAVSADILNSMRQQSHIILTAAVAGPTGVALINAAKLFVTPITIITPAVSQIFMARIVRLRQTAPLKLIARGVQFSALTAAIVVLYGLALALVFDSIKEYVVGSELPDLWPMVVAWLVVSTLSAILYGLQATQKALKRFKALLFTSLPVSIVGVGCIYLLLLAYGPIGAVYGLGAAQLLFIAVLTIMIFGYVREIRAGRTGVPGQ